MPFRSTDELADFARVLEGWHAPNGFTFCIAVVFSPLGVRESSVLVSFDYCGRGRTVAFHRPEKPRAAFRMLSAAAALVIGPERN